MRRSTSYIRVRPSLLRWNKASCASYTHRTHTHTQTYSSVVPIYLSSPAPSIHQPENLVARISSPVRFHVINHVLLTFFLFVFFFLYWYKDYKLMLFSVLPLSYSPASEQRNSQASNVIWSVRLMYNELGRLYTMVARAGRITKRVTARHTERNPVKPTLHYAVHTSWAKKRERELCDTTASVDIDP